MHTYYIPIVLTVGFILDLIVGDPSWLPHPIVYIGRLISYLEKKLYVKRDAGLEEGKRRKLQRFRGFLLWLITISICHGIPFILLFMLKKYIPYAALVLECYWATQILASKSLSKAAQRVEIELRKGDLEGARHYLSHIVGRDTKNLNEEEIVKAVIETVAENTSDGIVAPLFYMAIGGVPLAFLYKAVNTMDSMIGYKNDKYKDFGRFAAKADDVFNYIPAFITALAMIIFSFFGQLIWGREVFDCKEGIRIYKRDRNKHVSPNSGKPESVAAGVLSIQLGGASSYFGEIHHKATLGDENANFSSPISYKIARCIELMYGSAFVAFLMVVVSRLGLTLYTY